MIKKYIRKVTTTNIKTKIIETSSISDLYGDSHRYYNEKGEISLLYPCIRTGNLYEIYSWGELFEDCERFNSLTEAEERIYSILT